MARSMERSRSLPRYSVANKEAVTFRRDLQQESDDSYPSDVCTMREYVLPSEQPTPKMQRSSGNHETIKSNSTLYEPQQMVFMMPVEMNSSVGQMIPVLMTPGMISHPVASNTITCTLPNTHKMIMPPRQRRNRSLDACSIVNDDVSTYQTFMNSSSLTASRQGTIGETPKPVSGLMRPDQSNSIPRPLPRATNPPVVSPASGRRQNGLSRNQQQSYREPVVQNTIFNSEHPNPQKFRVAEKNLVKEIQQKEQEALQKINERLKAA
ncbi:hypothetical protein KIN20_000588 [Parelaphostrongylus tenuis]|uniref:Uncharacterized protein n=1 Tax=Parelaphostrongylus tenuis TaxID=148309 RepID=A0AAD5MDW5_PARTN|nr:hypothetical protein KIN20_000588 [Parelaphostrongylus tenuis]